MLTRCGGATRTVILEVVGRAVIAYLVWRFAAGLFWHDVVHYDGSRPFSLSYLPYRDRLWEFPPLTLVPVIAAQTARTWFPAVFVSFMVGCEYTSLVVLRSAWPEYRTRITHFWNATVMPLAVLGWFRFDFLVTVLATVAIVALIDGRRFARWIVLGFAVKLWPVLIAVAAIGRRRARDAATAILGCGLVVAMWWAFSPAGFEKFLRFRQGTGLEIESTLGAVRLAFGQRPTVVSGAWVVGAGGWTWVDRTGLLLLIVVSGGVAWSGRRWNSDRVLAAGGLVALSMVCGRIMSPQYLTWLAPFIVVGMIRGHRRLAPLFAVAVWLTLTYLAMFNQLLSAVAWVSAIVVVRNLVVIAIMIEFFAAARRDSASESEWTNAAKSSTSLSPATATHSSRRFFASALHGHGETNELPTDTSPAPHPAPSTRLPTIRS